jgi:uncharacterized protein YcsI (UPF0317 family)
VTPENVPMYQTALSLRALGRYESKTAMEIMDGPKTSALSVVQYVMLY